MIAGAAFVASAALLPLVLRALLREDYPVAADILILIGINAIAALGLNIIVGYCGLLNLGFAGFMLIGAYTTGILMKEYHFSFWLAALVSALHGALWGIVLGIPTLRLTGDYFAIVTFGFSELVIMVARNWVAITRGPSGYPGVPRPTLDFSWLNPAWKYQLTISDWTAYWYLVAAVLAVSIVVVSRLSRSRLGRAWRALREDEVAAEACGINAMWYKTIAFAISAGFGALAGSVQTSYYSFVDVRYFEFMRSVFVLCYIVLGGMGTIIGPIAGTAVLVTLGELLRENPASYAAPLFRWWPAAREWLSDLPWVPDLRLILYGAILVLMIRFRPEGLFPSRARARELHGELDERNAQDSSLFDLRMQ
jgi:branched-chain amino acid transport system permease protein